MSLAKLPESSTSKEDVECIDSLEKRSSLQEIIVNDSLTELCAEKSGTFVVINEGINEVAENSLDTSLVLNNGGNVVEHEHVQIKSNVEGSADCESKEDLLKPVRISERLSIKRNRLGEAEDGEITSPLPKKAKTAPNIVRKQPRKSSTSAISNLSPKWQERRRWTNKDKTLFFGFLGEYGKKFEVITKKMNHVHKMDGHPKKDERQIRYFYYRLCAKVSKLTRKKQSGGVKTYAQEINGLINYAVLWKNLKESDPQFSHCLNELIVHGETSFAVKSGRLRRIKKIKTPMCSHLKKLDRISDFSMKSLPVKRSTNKQTKQAKHQVPSQVTIELTPKNSDAWSRVQELSHNPRVRFKLSANRTLESVFKYLNTKWKSQRLRLKETIDQTPELSNEELSFHLHPSSKVTSFVMKSVKNKNKDGVFNCLPSFGKSKRSKSSNEVEEGEGSSSRTIREREDCEEILTNRINEIRGSEKISEKASKEIEMPEELSARIKYESEGLEEVSTEKSKKLNRLEEFSTNTTKEIGESNELCTAEKQEERSQSACLEEVLTNTVEDSTALETEKEERRGILPPNFNIPKHTNSEPLSGNTHHQAIVISDETPGCPIKNGGQGNEEDSTGTDAPMSCNGKLVIANGKDEEFQNEDLILDLESHCDLKKDEAEEEVRRLESLAVSGFTQSNTNTVTLLHLSLLLGGASVIQLEYEWTERHSLPKPNHIPAFFPTSSNQVANVLRRLCNIAALELASFQLNKAAKARARGEAGDCSGKKDGNTANSTTGSTSASSVRSKKQGVRNVGTMTEIWRSLGIMSVNKTTTTPSATNKLSPLPRPISNQTPKLQPRPAVNQDPVFRVPMPPTVPPSLSKEEEERLKVQQEQANAIMQLPYGPRRRLLKRRNVPIPKKPQVVLPRTILPKVSEASVLTYLKPGENSTSFIVNMNPQQATDSSHCIPKVSPHPSNTPPHPMNTPHSNSTATSSGLPLVAVSVSTSRLLSQLIDGSPPITITPTTSTIGTVSGITGTNILDMAIKNAQIIRSPVKEEFCENSRTNVLLTSRASPTPFTISKVSSSIPEHHADISISDLDISLAAPSSDLGPDAGDKFLDSVLERSHQGFAGLINPVSSKISSSSINSVVEIKVDNSLSSFYIPELKSPCKMSPSITPSTHLHHNPDQSWMNGESADTSLSSILGEFSSFNQRHLPQLKTPCKAPMSSAALLFDQSSSDAVVYPPAVPSMPPDSKPSFVSEMSLNSLLGDPSLSSPVSEAVKYLNERHTGGIQGEGPPSLVPPLPAALFSEASRDSLAKLDVDVSIQGMAVSEMSMDLISTFETLAAQMNQHTNGLDREADSSRLSAPAKSDHDAWILPPSELNSLTEDKEASRLNTPIKRGDR